MNSRDFESVITDAATNKQHMKLLRNIYRYGWSEMSNAQQTILPLILNHDDEYDDISFQYPSGMGKSGVYLLTMLYNIDPSSPCIQGLVVLPTRELAKQVYIDCRELARDMNINICKCIGREDMNLPDSHLPTIVIGTCGKIIDVICKKQGRPLHQVVSLHYLVIDEADNFLNTNRSIDDIKTIVKSVCKEKTHLFCVSATFNPEVRNFIQRHMMRENGRNIEKYIDDEEVTLAGIHQEYINLSEQIQSDRFENKVELLIDLIPVIAVTKAIIFLNTTYHVKMVYDMLRENNYAADLIYGSMSQEVRNQVLSDFMHSSKNFLIATDLVARGIDFRDIACVIQLELPVSEEDYIHRIGRSGRYGKMGRSIVIVNDKEMDNLRYLINKYKIDMHKFDFN